MSEEEKEKEPEVELEELRAQLAQTKESVNALFRTIQKTLPPPLDSAMEPWVRVGNKVLSLAEKVALRFLLRLEKKRV